ncbi:MAG: DUF4163 domain-containing protein, partial [Firmicutes bacterium]|nr:DUF4163 domain-containing protein [Bacillota bacterium]
VMAFSAPVAGFAEQSIVTNKRIYYTTGYNKAAMSYNSASVKLSKKSDDKEYIKVELTYPNFRSNNTNIKAFNTANKTYYRELGDDFIKEYTKSAKKYFDENKKSMSKKDDAPYLLKLDYSMKFNKNSVVSIFYTLTETTPEGQSVSYYTQNYDFVTGKSLTPDNVSILPKSGETMKLAVNTFNSKIKNGRNMYYQDVTITENDINFYFEKDAITFFVLPGVMADESRGLVTFRLDDKAARKYLLNQVN